MQKINLKEIIAPAAVLVAICVAVTGLLSLVYSVTKEPIEAAQAAISAEAMKELLAAEEYRAIDGEEASLAIDSGRVIGCLITTSAGGYGGDISVMTAFLTDGTVCGVKILSMEETPGVGTKTNSPEFLGQFINAVPVSGGDVSPSELPEEVWGAAIREYSIGVQVDANSRKIDGVTGATVSSRAICAAVTQAAETYDRLLAEGKLK